jgi:hypothetical protein
MINTQNSTLAEQASNNNGPKRAKAKEQGSRIRKVPSLDREKEVLRIGPKRVDCCGSLCARNDLETFSTPAY